MIIGEVTGSLWATKKDDSLSGQKLMIVATDENRIVVATDRIGAGIGDKVLICFGHAAHSAAKSTVDAAIVGIIDSIETERQ